MCSVVGTFKCWSSQKQIWWWLSYLIVSDSCELMGCSPPGSSVHGILQARIGVGCRILLQRIFLIQGLNLGLLHCKQIFYWLSHQGSPKTDLVDNINVTCSKYRKFRKDLVWRNQRWEEPRCPEWRPVEEVKITNRKNIVLTQEVPEFLVLVETVIKYWRRLGYLLEAICEKEGSDMLVLQGGCSYLNNEPVTNLP